MVLIQKVKNCHDFYAHRRINALGRPSVLISMHIDE